MKLTYAKAWFISQKRLMEAWDETRARAAYERRDLYTVIIGDPRQPTAYIESKGKYVGVGFLDGLLRDYLDCTFEEVRPEKLFLQMVTTREFIGDSDQVAKGTTYLFETDGRVVVRILDVKSNELSRGAKTMDVSENWKNYPAFGEYESLLTPPEGPASLREATTCIH